MNQTKKIYERLPQSPGVYLMKDAAGRVLYVGKAGNLRRRVASYYERSQDARMQSLVGKIRKIDYQKTDTVIEALILEAGLIKKLQPPYNVREKDDKSFLYVEITGERFPRVLLGRGKDAVGRETAAASRYGPFAAASEIRAALGILRRVFPWSVHPEDKMGVFKRPCLEYELGLCPGTCIGAADRGEYLKNIKNLKMFFSGKKPLILRSLEREMKAAGRRLEFEKAEKLRRQIFALKHIRDTALIGNSKLSAGGRSSLGGEIGNSAALAARRVEGYDVSNISGTSAVGSMVVFRNGEPDKNEYRKFRIRTVVGSNDVGMLKEILRRRFRNDWSLPDLILVDGGKGQVNAARSVLGECGLKIPVVGIAKGPKRRKNEFIGTVPEWSSEKVLVKVRDEAHRFAAYYHRILRERRSLHRRLENH